MLEWSRVDSVHSLTECSARTGEDCIVGLISDTRLKPSNLRLRLTLPWRMITFHFKAFRNTTQRTEETSSELPLGVSRHHYPCDIDVSIVNRVEMFRHLDMRDMLSCPTFFAKCGKGAQGENAGSEAPISNLNPKPQSPKPQTRKP